MAVSYDMGDTVQLKKSHACGANEWVIIRMGMDIRVKCAQCGHSVMIPRVRFDRLVRKLLKAANAEVNGDRGD